MNQFFLKGSVLGLIAAVLLESCRAPQGPTIVTASLADGTIGSSYSKGVLATGGMAPYSWGVVSGALPHGLMLPSRANNSVTISGTPDRVQSKVSFTIQVTDANGRSAQQPYSVNIKSAPTIVVTQSGAVRGVVQGNLLAFRGIPFAAPPLGNLRWQPPKSAANWSGVRDASTFGNVCPQLDAKGQPSGNEDCLGDQWVSQRPGGFLYAPHSIGGLASSLG